MIVHLPNDSANGRKVELYQDTLYRIADAGHTRVEVPFDDDRPHPSWPAVCPTCNPRSGK